MNEVFAKAGLLLVWVTFFGCAYGQLPVEKEPHHKIVFENKFVRVIDMVVPAGDTTLLHTHSAASAVMFLSASTFAIQNAGKVSVATTVKAGDVVYRNYDEVPVAHTVWCEDQNAFRCMVVELKYHSLKKGQPALPRQAKLLWQNALMEAYRLDLSAHSTCHFSTSPRACLLVNFSGIITLILPDKQKTIKEGEFEFIQSKSEIEILASAEAGVILLQLN